MSPAAFFPSVAGNAVCEDGLMLDMSGMKRISVDPERGRLTGIVVQLLTLVVDDSQPGDVTAVRAVPHAEWSVRLAF